MLVCGGQGRRWASSRISVHFYFEAGSLTEPGYHLILQTGWTPLALKFMSDFHMGAGNLASRSSGFHSQRFINKASPQDPVSILRRALCKNTRERRIYQNMLFFFFFETRPCYVALARSAVLLPLQRLQVCTPYLACWLLSSNHAVVTAEWEGVKRKWGLLHFSGKNQT